MQNMQCYGGGLSVGFSQYVQRAMQDTRIISVTLGAMRKFQVGLKAPRRGPASLEPAFQPVLKTV